MDLLLDTHAALWWADDPHRLRPDASAAITDPSNTAWLSSASAWELAIRVRSGKVRVDIMRLMDQLTHNGVRILGIGIDDAIAAGSLDWAHRDPFDRMLVAQAQRLDASLVTRDATIASFAHTRVLHA